MWQGQRKDGLLDIEPSATLFIFRIFTSAHDHFLSWYEYCIKSQNQSFTENFSQTKLGATKYTQDIKDFKTL
jgi:hypothetical protein